MMQRKESAIESLVIVRKSRREKMNLRRSRFFRILFNMNMLPLILFTLVITTLGAARFAASMNVEAKNGLVNLCHTVVILYDTLYQGEYHVTNQGEDIYMMKGQHLLNGNYEMIDSIKEKTGVDITIFYQDMRIITTIRTEDGIRAVGTKANAMVTEDVLKNGHPHFYASMMVEGVRYFSYYEPLYTSDGKCIGMIFLGKPSAEVKRLVFRSLSPIIVLGMIVMLIVCFVTVRFSGRLVIAIQKTELFMETIANGELHAELDVEVLERRDELGEMGRCLLRMQKSLRELVEQDILTGLYNRRSGEKLLKRTCDNYRKEGTPFCVAIGDIDHFKNINDTYGHECGDVALAEISGWIKSHMRSRGFAARWGGEEILLVYVNMRMSTAVSCLKELLEEIRAKHIEYENTMFGITMTFGLAEGNDRKVEHIVRDADTMLYEGKNSGRNRIVYETYQERIS